MLIGYARCSTAEQNLDLQLNALKDAGAERVFADQGISGSQPDRPQLSAALDHLREDDVFIVWRLDRLGRNTRATLEFIDELQRRGVGFQSLTENLSSGGPMGRLMVTMLSAFAELERDLVVERTRAGLSAARAKGRYGGRPRKVNDAQATKARQLKEKGVSVPDIAKLLGISRASAYRYLGQTT